jgi:hypothetical protein
MPRSPRLLLASIVLVAMAGACGAASRLIYESPLLMSTPLRGAKTLVVPITHTEVRYKDNTKAVPDTLYTDSFLVAAANALFAFQASQHFLTTPILDSSLGLDSLPSASILAGDTALLSALAARVRGIASKAGVQFVVVAHACTSGFTVFQAQGWRGDKYDNPAYARPIKAYGWARLHVQLWSAAGNLLYERIGVGSSGKPMLYDLVKRPRRHPPRRTRVPPDIVTLAKKGYGPPTVRALLKAARAALQIR